VGVIWGRADLGEVFGGFSAGYRSGKRTEPLFGVDWNELWSVPITDLRERFGIDQTAIVGEGIRAAA
jgi:ubiquinone biosynthesis protein Coq4